jgi:hypothetical protein
MVPVGLSGIPGDVGRRQSFVSFRLRLFGSPGSGARRLDFTAQPLSGAVLSDGPGGSHNRVELGSQAIP